MNDKSKAFGTDQIKAIQQKKKNQFREVVAADLDNCNFQTLVYEKFGAWTFTPSHLISPTNDDVIVVEPPLKVGDKIFVREQWAKFSDHFHYLAKANPADLEWLKSEGVEWQTAESMPEKYSRLSLEITGISIQRIQNICAADALAEGISETKFWQPASLNEKPFEEKWWDDFHFWTHYPQIAFADWWKANEGEKSWSENKWVWVYRFKQVKNLGAER